MSFIEKVTYEGIFDYFTRRIAFLFGVIVLVVSLGYLVVSQFVSEKNLAITIVLSVIAFINFIIALITFAKYKELKSNANIKYIKMVIKLCKLIVGIVGFALTMSIALATTHDSAFLTVVNVIMVVMYALYIASQLAIMFFSFLFSLKAQKRKKERVALAQSIAIERERAEIEKQQANDSSGVTDPPNTKFVKLKNFFTRKK